MWHTEWTEEISNEATSLQFDLPLGEA
jgi:hypothetical protein